MNNRLIVKKGYSISKDPAKAIAELASQILQQDTAVVIVFCSPIYDLDLLGEAIKASFNTVVIGCTTAGEIMDGIGYLRDGLIGVSLSSTELVAHSKLISPLNEFNINEASVLVYNTPQKTNNFLESFILLE